jgi:hypothetical protein
MASDYELSNTARDAFVALHGAVEIRYRDGDIWRLEDGQDDHPIVAKLRAAARLTLLTEPPTPLPPGADRDTVIERQVNERLREFCVQLQSLCEARGAPVSASGGDLLAWLETRLGDV